MPHVTVDICTKDRYEQLPLTLVSIAMQTRKPDKVIIYDDSSQGTPLPEIETIRYALQLLDSKKIDYYIIWGKKLGQHHGHQIIQKDFSKELIWRIDDDEIAEPNVLEVLLSNMQEGVGGVAGLVIPPDAEYRDCPATHVVDSTVNCQWFRWEGKKEVEHFYSSYLYRKGISDFNLNLSPVAHREETLHSYGMFKKGYKLIVDASAVTYHFRSGKGGIRASGKQQDWEQDELIFQEQLREHGIFGFKEKNFVLDCGMGDTIVFKSLLPQIKEKYKDYKLIFYVCCPELFKGEGLDLRSIAEAYQRLGNLDRFNIFRWGIDRHWRREIKYAFAEMYGVSI
jgi:hypothetical protein